MYHTLPFTFVTAAAKELNVLKLVVVTFALDSDFLPGTVVAVVGGAFQDDGFFGGADHPPSCVLAYADTTIGASEHDGHTGFDGEQGVAVDVNPTINDVVHIQTQVGPCDVVLNAT